MAGHGIHGGGVHGGNVNKKKVSEDSVSVGSSTNHSDDSKYDNLSASSSTSINSSGRQQVWAIVHFFSPCFSMVKNEVLGLPRTPGLVALRDDSLTPSPYCN